MYKKNHIKGFSLIELMIAMVIGVLLLLGATGLFISNKRIYKEQNSMGRLQENARFAMQLLIRDIRSAGFTGCADTMTAVANDITTNATNLLSYTATTIVEGSDDDGAWTPSLSGDPAGSWTGATTDAITVRSIQPIQVNVSAATTATLVPAASTSDIAANDAVAVFDCASANIFQTTGLVGGLQHGGITNSYGTDAGIAKFYAVRYYIDDINDADGDGVNDPALWRRITINGNPVNQELIEGVEDMQILYGVDNTADGIPDSYQNAAGVAGNGGWANVISVQLALLFRTIEQNFHIETDSQTFNMLGKNVPAAGDYRRRKLVNTTVMIRNNTSL